MRYKIFILIILFMAIISYSNVVFAAQSSIEIILDDNMVRLNPPPFVDKNGFVYVPLRAVADLIGAKVSWDASSQSAVVINNGKTSKFKVGAYYPQENKIETPFPILGQVIIKNNKVYVPVFLLKECFGSVSLEIETSGAIIVSLNSFSEWDPAQNVVIEPLSEKHLAPTIFINNRPLSSDVPPVIIEGRTLVPVRAMAKALGASVSWDEKNKAVTLNYNQKSIRLIIGSKTAYAKGKAVQIDVPAEIIDGRTFAPLRFLGNSLEAKILWQSKDRTIHFNL